MLRSLQHSLAAAALSLLSAIAIADESVTRSEGTADGQAPLLRLNVSTGGYPPYLIVPPDREYSGIAYEVVTRIADRLGYAIEALEIPRKRVDSLLLGGHIDATPRAREWTENPEQFLFTDTIVPVREVFFTTTDSDFQFRGLHSLRGLTLATPLGYHYPLRWTQSVGQPDGVPKL